MRGLKIIALSVLIATLAMTVTNCCKKCCSPSIEVGVCDPQKISHSCQNFEIKTWDPVWTFPLSPNTTVSGNQIQAMRPYLFRTKVTNFSDVPVRGVTVAFYWASFGVFDGGTPIGSVGVDLEANESVWVRSPWSFSLMTSHKLHLCLSVRVFHPCDTVLENNWCWRNLTVIELLWPLKVYYVPFTADFKQTTGELDFKIEAPKGIEARIIGKEMERGAAETAPDTRSLSTLIVQPDKPQQLALMVKNVGANYNSGDSFDVTVRAFKGKREISSFTVTFKVK